jgi:hypothetical protein
MDTAKPSSQWLTPSFSISEMACLVVASFFRCRGICWEQGGLIYLHWSTLYAIYLLPIAKGNTMVNCYKITSPVVKLFFYKFVG